MTEMIEKQFELNGITFNYNSQTEFIVQVGKHKGSYKTRVKIVGDFGRAFMHYQGINVGNGYKKRLLMPSNSDNRVLAREYS